MKKHEKTKKTKKNIHKKYNKEKDSNKLYSIKPNKLFENLIKINPRIHTIIKYIFNYILF